jgi:6-pyruvoyltetrahydropterin/6-carboxytetrahydropterin synthase
MTEGLIWISKEFHFSAGHQLYREDWSQDKNWRVFDQCTNEHGHNYVLEVTVSGPIDPETGMILNYYHLNNIVKPIVDRMDHCPGGLNELFRGMLTTAENLVERIAQLISDELAARPDAIHVAQVVLRETPKTRAVWRS